MKKLLLFPICLLWSVFCFSQNWFPVASSEDCLFEVNLSSIERDGILIYCWRKMTYENEEARFKEANRLYEIWDDKTWLKYDHTLNYVVYDCSGKKSQILSSVYYDQNGKVIYSNDEYESSLNYKRLIPGTVGMSIFDALNDEHLFEVDGVKYKVYIEDIPYFLYKNPRKTEYLGNNSDIKLMTLKIILECLENIRDEMRKEYEENIPLDTSNENSKKE